MTSPRRPMPAFMLVAYNAGAISYRAGRMRSLNPFYHERATTRGRMKYHAWAKGWVDACYTQMMKEQADREAKAWNWEK